jgi:hypothetical protein
MPTNAATSTRSAAPSDTPRGADFRLVRGTRDDLLGVAWTDLNRDPRAVRVKANDLREVWRFARGQDVLYAKIFRPARRWERIRLRLRGRPEWREWRVGRSAERRGVAAIRFAGLLEPVRSGGAVRAVLVSNAVANASTLADAWRAIGLVPDPAERARQARALIDIVARLVANAHTHGFLHRDTHPDNLLIARNEEGLATGAVFADLGRARLVRSVSERQAAVGLAELAQWFRLRSTVGQRVRFLDVYLACRHGWTPRLGRSPQTRAVRRRFARRVERLARRRQRWLASKRDRRIFGNNEFFHTASFGGGWRGTFTLQFRGREHAPRPTQPDRTPAEWIAWTEGALSETPGTEGIVRAARRLGLSSRVSRAGGPGERARWTCRGSPAKQAFRDGHRRRNRDLPVVAPVACFERHVAGLVVESILLTETEEGGAES